MKIDTETTENLSYEKPTLKKYGTMKDITLGQGSSGADFAGQMGNDDDAQPDKNDGSDTYLHDASSGEFFNLLLD